MPLNTQFAPLSRVAGALIPTIAATGGLYYMFRATWPKAYTWTNEWEHKTEESFAAKPMQGAPNETAVMNPFGSLWRPSHQ